MELKKRYYIIDTDTKTNHKVIRYGHIFKDYIDNLFDTMDKVDGHIYHIVWSTKMSGCYDFTNGVINGKIWKDLDWGNTYHIVK